VEPLFTRSDSGGEGVARRGVEAARVRVPAVAGCGQSAGCCRVPLPLPGQWRAGRAAAINVQTVSRSSRTAVGPDPGTPPRRPAFPTNGTVTAAAAGSAPKIGFLRVLQHNTRTRARMRSTVYTYYYYYDIINFEIYVLCRVCHVMR